MNQALRLSAALPYVNLEIVLLGSVTASVFYIKCSRAGC